AESMLDQLVAFCGETVEEKDVLSVFGFTSRQTVSELCGALLAQDAPHAMRLVHEQAEAGRDLTQLMGDLIGHLRNLLLAQADPRGLVEELGRSVVEALQEQCADVNRERLLELIDLCASAEQRMKWASNKQMYLEVALTLGEVLDALGAIREGRPLSEKSTVTAPSRPKQQSPRPVALTVPAAKPAATVVHQPSVTSKTSAAKSQEISNLQAPEATKPSVENAPVVERSLAQEKAVPQVVDSSSDRVWKVEELWPAMVEMVRKERPLISMWVEAGVLAEVVGGIAHILFPADQTLAVEYVAQENNRGFLEGVLQKVAGFPLKLSVGMRAGIQLRPVAQPPAPEKILPKDPMEEFKNDPLIRKALEIFKARLEAV
ncbi:MAG: hypothetical protein EBR81_13740, partial [Proteobacteria bacterium]|nr:hypothetical protein [Pseudomonadota bacterium]